MTEAETIAEEDNLDTNTSETPEEDNSQTEEQEETEAVDQAELRREQQREGSKREVEKYKSIAFDAAIKAAKLDGNSLLELHDQDPKLARQVAKHFGYDSIDAVKSFLSQSDSGEEVKTGSMSEDEFEKMYEKRRKEEVHKESLKKAEKFISNIEDEDQRERAEAYFEKIVGNKKLTEEDALDYAEMATLFVSKDKLKGERKEEALAKAGSTGLSLSKKPNSQEPMTVVRNGKLILLDSNNNQ